MPRCHTLPHAIRNGSMDEFYVVCEEVDGIFYNDVLSLHLGLRAQTAIASRTISIAEPPPTRSIKLVSSQLT